jgi:hypothetical protein
MQKGSLIRSSRRQGPDVWEYRWRESCSGQRRKHRRIVIGTLNTLKDESAVLKAIAALRRDININDRRMKTKPLRLAELIEHFRQRELAADNEWKTLSTRVTYEGYLRKWTVPRWGATNLCAIRAVEVELWLRTLPLARASRAKIRNLMSVLFNHARRHDFTDHNPITLVRQSAKAAHCARSAPAFRNQLTRSQFAEQREDSCSLGCGHGASHERTVRSKVARHRLRRKTG